LQEVPWKRRDLCGAFTKANAEMFGGPFAERLDGNEDLAAEVWEKNTFSFLMLS